MATRHRVTQVARGNETGVRGHEAQVPPLLMLMTPPWLCHPLISAPLTPLSQFPDQTWYLLVELKGISATLGFLSLIFLTEPQDSSMHLSRADSEASPAVSRCQERVQCYSGAGEGWRANRRGHATLEATAGCEGKQGISKGPRPTRQPSPPTLDTEMFSCPPLKTARLQRPAIRDRAVHVADRLSNVAPGRKRGRTSSLVPR